MAHFALKYWNGIDWIVTKEFEGDQNTAQREFTIARAQTHPGISIVIEKYLHDPNAVESAEEIEETEDTSEEAPVKRTRRKD